MSETKIILDFISQTDFAAAIRPTYHCPGAVKLAAYFDYFKNRNPEGTILLDAGDILVAAPIMHLSDGKPVVEIVNFFGYDAMTLGNHEFDYGQEKMNSLLSKAQFPILCANIIENTTGRLLEIAQPYVILEKKGVKIGVLGVTTIHTPYMVKQDMFTPYTVTSVVESCKKYIPMMKEEGAEIIVVLGHLPGKLDQEGNYVGELFDVADQIVGADIIFGGHDKADLAVIRNGTIISKAGHSAECISHIKIEYDISTQEITCLENEIVDVLHGNLNVRMDPEMKSKVDQIMAPYINDLDEILGQALDDLFVERFGEFSLGNFYTDSMKEVCEADISFMNSTSCFGFIPKGPITAEMIMYLMCFNENLFAGSMSGEQIRKLVELTYSDNHLALNGNIQFSGMKVIIDSQNPQGHRIVSLTLESGEPIIDDKQYRVATTAYIASGGNNYREIISQTNWIETEFMTHSVFIEKMRERKILDSVTEGRFTDLANESKQ